MRRNLKYFFLIAAGLAAVVSSCSKEGRVNVHAGDLPEDGALLLEIKGEASEEPATKSSSSMDLGSTVGLFVCEHTTATPNPYTEHSTMYNNLCATYQKFKPSSSSEEVVRWMYNYKGYSSQFPSLYLAYREDDGGNPVTADIFAYSPYNSEVTSPEAIPFSIVNQVEALYAEQNSTSANKEINPSTVSPDGDGVRRREVPLTFKHSLAKLQFNFTLKNGTVNHPDGSSSAVDYSIDTIFVKVNTDDLVSPKSSLYDGGVMNAITGAIVQDEVTADGTRMFFPQAGGMSGAVMLRPVEYYDKSYVFEFSFNGITLPSKFILEKAQIQHGTSGTYGLKTGYVYNFDFTIDNQVHLSRITIADWDTPEDPLYEISI